MIIDIVSIGIIFFSIAILILIIGHRMRIVASINVKAIPQEQESLVRKRLLHHRFNRKTIRLDSLLNIQPVLVRRGTACTYI